MRTALGVVLTSLIAAWACMPGCTARDCDSERAGQMRCVGNRLELCNDDGTLTYTSCSTQGLVCSETLGACVTSDVAMQSGSGGGGGAGGAGGAGGS